MYRNLINESEKNRILNMHKNFGYNTINEAYNSEPQSLDNDSSTLKYNMKGDKIAELQKKLGVKNKYGQFSGIFLDKTEGAIKSKFPDYDRNKGITLDMYNTIINGTQSSNSSSTAQGDATTSTNTAAQSSTQGNTATTNATAQDANSKDEDKQITIAKPGETVSATVSV